MEWCIECNLPTKIISPVLIMLKANKRWERYPYWDWVQIYRARRHQRYPMDHSKREEKSKGSNFQLSGMWFSSFGDREYAVPDAAGFICPVIN